MTELFRQEIAKGFLHYTAARFCISVFLLYVLCIPFTTGSSSKCLIAATASKASQKPT